jgi:hypothetical protein
MQRINHGVASVYRHARARARIGCARAQQFCAQLTLFRIAMKDAARITVGANAVDRNAAILAC